MFAADSAFQSKFFLSAMEAAAPALRVQVISVPVRTDADIESALAGFSQQPNSGLALPTFGLARLGLVADLASRYRLPSIGTTPFASYGDLMDYGVSGDFGQAAYRRRPGNVWSSTSRPPRRSASPSQKRC
jgi:hypothetical protein